MSLLVTRTRSTRRGSMACQPPFGDPSCARSSPALQSPPWSPSTCSSLVVPRRRISERSRSSTSMPKSGAKPASYETAERRDSRTWVERKGMGIGGGSELGRPGGPPVGGGNPAVAQTAVHWTTAQEDTVTKQWEELADKLKVPAPKKE